MLKKLRVKFILMMMSFTILLLGSIFGLIYHFTAADLAQSSFEMMQAVALRPSRPERPGSAPDSVRLPFFTVEVSKTGAITAAGSDLYDLSDEDFLRELVLAAQADGKNDGLLSSYHLRFFRAVTPDGEKYVFADTSAEQATLKSLIRTSVLIGLGSLAVFFALSVLLARWAVRPVELAWQQQKQFVADASHELKTPLASIKLLSDSILQNDMDADTMREFVSDIGNESDRLTRMTQKLLTLSKADAQTTCEHEVVDLGETVRRVFRMLVPLADRTQIQLTASLDRGCYVLSMEDDAYQIIFNLVENGIKYNHAGGSVHVTARHTQDEAELLVEDTGMGIPQDAIEHIFERFYRVDKARSRQAGGSGLGLSIVHELVERNFGTIEVSSKEGEGTKFTVRMPYFELEEDDGDA